MRRILSLGAFSLSMLFLFQQCLVADQPFNKVAPGIWRGMLTLEKTIYPVADKDSIFIIYDQFKDGELPFNFEVKYKDDASFYVEIINGSERIRIDSIEYGRDRVNARDTVNIWFPEYQSYIHVDVRGADMQGEWIVTTKKNYRIPFRAKAGEAFRFTSLQQKPIADLSGQWAVLFGVDGDDPEKAVGEFKQEGNRLTGTFRTETGDYRFLEGTVQGRKFWLSCFDGSHAFLFNGSIKGDSLQGEFRSGKSRGQLWSAWRDPDFKLGDPSALTTIKEDAAPISFSMKTPEGKNLTFPSADFDGKVKIFTIMGTWCPNCRDEQIFLRTFLEKNPELSKKMAVVGFSFERHDDVAKANEQLLNYKKKLGIPFDIVYAGKANKEEASRVFPALSKVMAFPTMIILDKQNKVRKIHTGFDGPATSKYADYEAEFMQLMQTLAAE